MRDRRSSDWGVDLADRHGVETQVEHALAAHVGLRLVGTSTSSFQRLDFQLVAPVDHRIELELKAKRQPLSSGWRQLRPDVRPADLFVLDELALRKMVDVGRDAFLLVRDIPADRWCLWSAGDLVVASRTRHTRRLDVGSRRSKGKLLLDLSEAGHITGSLADALDALCAIATHLEAWWHDIAPWPALRGPAR